MKFLNHEQRDPRLNEILYPYCDVKKAQQLIDQFEGRSGTSSSGGQCTGHIFVFVIAVFSWFVSPFRYNFFIVNDLILVIRGGICG